MPALASVLSHLSAVMSSRAPPGSIWLHVPGDALHIARCITDTVTRATTTSPPPAPGTPPSIDALLPKVASLDLAHLHSAKAAFDSILHQLSAWSTTTSNAAWDERDLAVHAPDPTLARLSVVRAHPGKRTANRSGRSSPPAKRARTDRGDSPRRGGSDTETEAEARADDDDEPRWTLEWDRDAPAASGADKPALLAPLRNTLESFHHSLRTLLALASPGGLAPSLSSTASSSLDPAADLAPTPGGPARRFIVVEHGELLGELAGGGGGAGGAARESGGGVTFASALHRLAEITGLPITVVTISRLPWHKMRESMVGLPSPELLTVDDMTSAGTSPPKTIHLLTTRFAASPLSQPTPHDTLSHAQLVELFRSLALVVRTTFGQAVTEVDELAYLCARLWGRWKEVRERSNPPIAPTDTARLSIALKPDFAAELERLFLPRVALADIPPPPAASASACGAAGTTPTAAAAGLTSTGAGGEAVVGFTGRIAPPPKRPTYLDSPSRNGAEAGPSGGGSGSGDFFAARAAEAVASPARPAPSGPFDPFSSAAAVPSSSSLSLSRSTPSSLSRAPAPGATLAKSLPLAARYVLLAAYFAAHNPPKSDVRMFVRVDELEGVAKRGKKVRRGKKAGKKGASPKKSAASLLSGGKSFPLERLVALFDAIVDARLEYALGTPAVLALVQTLVQLRLLTRASAGERVLDGVKLRCAVERSEADALAVSVGWREWKERLVGEED